MASKIGMQKKGSLSIVQFPLARWNSVFFHIIPIPSLPVIPPEVDGVWMVCFFLGPVIDSSRFTGVWKPIAGRLSWLDSCMLKKPAKYWEEQTSFGNWIAGIQ